MAYKQPPRKLLRKRPRSSYHEMTSDDEGDNCSSTGDTNFSNESRPFGVLPKNVSDWTIFDLDKLAISYDRTAKPTPSDVLQLVTDKTGFYGNLTIEQQEVMKVITDNLVFDLEIDEENLKQQQYMEGIITELRLTEDKLLQKQMEPISSHKQFMICSYALDFLTEVKRVIYKMADYNLGKETVPESFYTSLTSSFARICQLTPVPGLLYKTKLQIDTVEVTSIPDLVLEKKKNITSASSVVSIIEVKKAVITKAEENKEDKDDKKSKADIQHWLSEKVLGQHGGELLLAWNSVETEYVPGMIAVGTKIYFTLLHISLNHVRTLGPGVADMKEVDKHRATIYYSESKDILVKDDRNSLIQSIMRLNN
ncbi:uncharacterized protein [Mytilus edulis]|uniref:uncharacterized protein isoform X1 n=1 Tax=Mytilus edulis TaxID=6550 RepID=UPI0039EE1173